MESTLVEQDVSMGMPSFIGWVGGKRLLAKTIAALLPRHTCYVEVFGGAAWVLFAKEPSRVEVYNDLNGRLVELFRCAKAHPEELVRQLDMVLASREMFKLFQRQEGLTEIERAARFFYLTQQSFNRLGKVFSYGRTPGAATTGMRLHKLLGRLDDVRERLVDVRIERDDFGAVLARYDGPETCFFLDPPYYGCEHNYDIRLQKEDHERLAATLATTKARWLVTYNDHAWVRRAYRRHRRFTVAADYTSCVNARRPGHQLIIINYALTRAQRAHVQHKLKPLSVARKGG